jgi:hypothetical protein
MWLSERNGPWQCERFLAKSGDYPHDQPSGRLLVKWRCYANNLYHPRFFHFGSLSRFLPRPR